MKAPVPIPKRSVIGLSIATLLITAVWALPVTWYRPSVRKGSFVWLNEQSHVPGWTVTNIPIGKAAEAMLVGDRMMSSEFYAETNRALVRVFSAKRYLEKENEVGLFSHTPDRCWTAAGWQIKLVEPQFLDFVVHGIPMCFERRVFEVGPSRELCYFTAVVGGKPLPYRLNQYLGSSLRKTEKTRADGSSVWLRLKDNRMWSWAWKSFLNRTAFGGPQQFIRVSTPIAGSNIAEADARLQAFLRLWLKPTDYDAEVAEWRRSVERGATAGS